MTQQRDALFATCDIVLVVPLFGSQGYYHNRDCLRVCIVLLCRLVYTVPSSAVRDIDNPQVHRFGQQGMPLTGSPQQLPCWQVQ